MEHKLVNGGEQCLPFARSRIKALRATGLQYVSQSYEIDGISIKVKISGEHDYIRIDGPSAQMDMDSGIVEMGPYTGAERYTPGTFFETSHAAAYNASFQKPVWPGWRGGGTKGLVTGSFKADSYGAFTCRVRYDGSVSRAAVMGKVSVPDGYGGEEYVDDPADDALVARKLMMQKCPPSVFTGRCRLYVQAMYGRPAYTEASAGEDGKIRTQPEKITWPTLLATYVLELQAYTPPRGTATSKTVAINTSTGVFLDKETGNHWLFNVGFGTFTIYPLISSTSGEALRKLLKSGSKLAGDALDHLEAHILAESLPDVRKKVDVVLSPSVGTFSCGYGWHWNRSGTKSDIVINNTYEQISPSDPQRGMESTHYRISITPLALATADQLAEPGAPSRSFSVSLTVIEGPTRWAVSRQAWCIAYPLPDEGMLLKLTPKYSNPFTAKGFFYAFYVDDELTRCEVDVRQIDEEDEVHIEPAYYRSPQAAITQGMEGGSYKVIDKNPAFWTAVFSFGAESTRLSTLGFNHRTDESSIYGKEVIENIQTSHGVAFTTTVNYGEPNYSPQKVVFPLVVTNPSPLSYKAYDIRTFLPWVQFKYKNSSLMESKYTQVAVAIPMDDAEAIYYGGYQTSTSSESGDVYTLKSYGQYARTTSVDGQVFLHESRIELDVSASITISAEVLDPTPRTTTDYTYGSFKCRAGVAESPFSEEIFLEFHSPVTDVVSDPFKTRTGYRIQDPCVMWSKAQAVGTNGHGLGFSSIVGWI